MDKIIYHMEMREKFVKERDFEKAFIHAQKALSLAIDTYGPYHLLTAAAFNDLGSILLTVGQYEDAEQYLLASIDSLEICGGQDSPELAVVKKNLGKVYFQTGQFKESKTYFEEARRIQLKVNGDHDIPDFAEGLEAMADFEDLQGKHESARRHREIARQYREA